MCARCERWSLRPAPEIVERNRDQLAFAALKIELGPMSSTVTLNKLPRSAILHDESLIELVADMTRRGNYSLDKSEVRWRDRQPALDKRGYILRRRYAPDWKPSWLGTNIDPFYCEDSILSRVIVAHSVPRFLAINIFIVSRTTRSSTQGDAKMEWW